MQKHKKKNKKSLAPFLFWLMGLIIFLGLTIPDISQAAKVIKSKEVKLKDPNLKDAAKKVTELFPSGCRKVGYAFKYYVLTLYPNAVGGSHSLYFIHNTSSKPVKFYQMRTGDEPYIMHLNNEIAAKQWGVFATDEKEVKFICTVPSKNSKFGDITNCEETLELCEFTNVKFSINNYGNYWAVPSNSLTEAKYEVINQGVLLRW